MPFDTTVRPSEAGQFTAVAVALATVDVVEVVALADVVEVVRAAVVVVVALTEVVEVVVALVDVAVVEATVVEVAAVVFLAPYTPLETRAPTELFR